MADNTASRAAQSTVTNQHKKAPFVAGTTTGKNNNIVASSSADTASTPPTNGKHVIRKRSEDAPGGNGCDGRKQGNKNNRARGSNGRGGGEGGKPRDKNAKFNAKGDSTAGGGTDGVRESRARAGGGRDNDGDASRDFNRGGGWGKKREMKMQQVEALMESSKAEPEQEAVEIRTEMEGEKKTQNENAGCEDSIADDREHEQNATGEETREKNSSDEKEGSKCARALDKPRVPAINLHYDALVPNGHIDSTHLNKLMGYKIKTSEQQEEVIEQWQDWKKEVRVWAAYKIKERMTLEALKIPEDDNFTTPNVEGRPISKFLDIKKWWAKAPADCLRSEATFSHLAYGMWEKFWERNMEEEFMEKFGWSYDQEVKERAQKECGRAGYVMKGCVAKNMAHVKGEIVKGLQKRGRQADHGKTIKKRREKDEAYTEDGSYIKRKKAAIKVVKVDDSDDDKKPAAATKEEGDIGNNIDVDIVDNFVIFSSPLPEKQGGKKNKQANLSTPDKEVQKKKPRKKKTPSPSPVYVPSEYELKAMQKRKEIAEYIAAKFPKENKEVITICYLDACFSLILGDTKYFFQL